MSSPNSSTSSSEDRLHDSLARGPMRRILLSSFTGSVIEFYDFVLYVIAAATVFPHVFFASLTLEAATIASFASLAVGYVARPIGGIIFGHFGDKLGRKGVLVTTMIIMGSATMLVGLIPASSAVGMLAPILLIACRVIQGLAVGGEWGGAMLIALEHAPGGKRGFAASFASLGAPAGAMLATGSISLASTLPEDQFLAWGWRVPFFLSFLLVVIGLYIRLKINESPLFKALDEEADRRRFPIIDVIRRYPFQILIGILVAIIQLTIDGVITAWAVNYSVSQGADQTQVLNWKIVASIALLVFAIVGARVSDHVGRRPVLIVGTVLAIVTVFPILSWIESGTVAGFATAAILGQAIQGLLLGPLAAFLAELFPTQLRFTGSSLCFQVAAALGSGFTPLIAASLVATSGGILLLGGVWAGVLVVGLLAVFIAKEGRTKILADI